MSSDAPPAGAHFAPVVRSRSTLTLIEGLGSRLHQVLSPRAAARTPAWRAVAVLSAALDVGKARWLRRNRRFALGPRLLLDAVDLAVWCIAARDDTDTSEDAVIPGVALAAEAGARLGLAGFAVPLTHACVAAGVRRCRGHALRLEQFSWQAMGVGGGWTLSVLARRRRAALEAEHDRDRRALVQGARLAGLNDVVMTNEGAIDVLQRATALVELGGVTARRRDFAGAYKAEVAAAVRAQATYLRDALMVWQLRHNLQPDLQRAVGIELPAAAGTVLLTSEQVARLHAALDALELSGSVAVAPVDPVAATRPGGARDLFVNDATVRLPSREPERRWIFDAVPTAFLMNVGWLLQPTGRHREAVPWPATALPLAMSAGATVWSARRAERVGRVSPRAALALSLTTTFIYTVTSSRAMRHSHTGIDAQGREVSRFPWVLALQGSELVRSIVAPELEPGERALGAIASGAIVTCGWFLSPRPRSARSFLAELPWVTATVVGARALRDAIRSHGAELEVAVHEGDDLAAREAYRLGRARAHDTIAAAVAEAERTIAAAVHVDAELRTEASRRLGLVRELLRTT